MGKVRSGGGDDDDDDDDETDSLLKVGFVMLLSKDLFSNSCFSYYTTLYSYNRFFPSLLTNLPRLAMVFLEIEECRGCHGRKSRIQKSTQTTDRWHGRQIHLCSPQFIAHGVRRSGRIGSSRHDDEVIYLSFLYLLI